MKLLNVFRLTMTLLGALTLIGACRVVQAQEPRQSNEGCKSFPHVAPEPVIITIE